MSIHTWLFPGSFTLMNEIRVLDVIHPFIQIGKHLLGTHLLSIWIASKNITAIFFCHLISCTDSPRGLKTEERFYNGKGDTFITLLVG